MEDNVAPGITVLLTGEFEQALELTKDRFAREGFGVLTRIDMNATLKDKLGLDMAPYTILGMCNPRLASSAVQIAPEIGLFLPCNVVVRMVDGGVEVSAMNPAIITRLLTNPALEPMATEALDRVSRAMNSLTE